MKKYLILNDGTVFEGIAFGSDNVGTGRIIFNLVNNNVPESLSTPNNYASIVVSSDPLIGIREVETMDLQSLEPNIKGFIVNNFSHLSRDSGISVDRYLKEKNIPGIMGINVHRLIDHLADQQKMNASIVEYVDEHAFDQLRAFVSPTNLTDFVSTKAPYLIPGNHQTVVVIDLGMKVSLYRVLIKSGLNCVVLPYNCDFDTIDTYHPDGIIITNGPGSLEELTMVSDKIIDLASKYPILGLGLGQAIIAKAFKIPVFEKKHIPRFEKQNIIERSTGDFSSIKDNANYIIPYKKEIKKQAYIYLTDVRNRYIKAFRIRKHNIIGISFDFEPYNNGGKFLLDEFIENL